MRETTKRYIKRYTMSAIELTSGLVFWGAIVSVVYMNVLYRNLYSDTLNK
jgi:hypothetical protein